MGYSFRETVTVGGDGSAEGAGCPALAMRASIQVKAMLIQVAPVSEIKLRPDLTKDTWQRGLVRCPQVSNPMF